MQEPTSLESLALTASDAARLNDPLSDERLLSRSQAAEFLGVSPRTIDAWCANIRERKRRRRAAPERSESKAVKPSRERLPYIKLGLKVFFQLGDLRRFRDERKVAA